MEASVEERFQRNCELWSPDCPQGAVRLNFLDCTPLSFCKTERGEENLTDGTFFYHDQRGALREAKENVDSLGASGAELLYFYGVGLGYSYQAAKKWLKENPRRMVLFLEDDLRVIHRFFETERATEMLSDPQTKLIYLDRSGEMEREISQLCWDFYGRKLAVFALPSYRRSRAERFVELEQRLLHESALKETLIQEYLARGELFFTNFYKNLKVLDRALLGNRFFGQFQGVPAIICGAGPSLARHFDALTSLKERALLFAGGSALVALHTHRIFPHFGAALDPNPSEYDRLKELRDFRMPFFYRNRLYPRALEVIGGPKLYITGSGGYDVASWFEKRLGIDGDEIDEGHNVINFALEIAHAMGCNPIIFVGMDLAYTGLERYAPGIVEETALQEEEILRSQPFDGKAFLRDGIDGRPVYTLWKWVAEAKWIGLFAKAHPDRALINATEGGIGFPGVVNCPLSEVISSHLCNKVVLDERIGSCLKRANLPTGTQKKVAALMEEMAASLERAISALDILIEEEEEAIKKASSLSYQSGRAALAESDLMEEAAFQAILEVFNGAFSLLARREVSELRARPEEEASRKHAHEIALTKFHFLRSVARSNLDIMRAADP